jgi:hypothetical protein
MRQTDREKKVTEAERERYKRVIEVDIERKVREKDADT